MLKSLYVDGVILRGYGDRVQAYGLEYGFVGVVGVDRCRSLVVLKFVVYKGDIQLRMFFGYLRQCDRNRSRVEAVCECRGIGNGCSHRCQHD